MAKNDPESKDRIIQGAVNSMTDECIMWPHCLDAYGYPIRQIKGRAFKVHAIVCAIVSGARPHGHLAAHKCGRRSCINGRHLYWATPLQNSADIVKHGTGYFGERHHKAKLNQCDIRNIRGEYAKGGISFSALARFFAVTPALIRWIVRRDIWQHVN